MQAKHGHETVHLFKDFTSAEMGAYLQYKKNQGKGNKKDGAMPKDGKEWRKWCIEYISCPFPFSSLYQSKDEDGEVGEASSAAVTALLSLTGQTLHCQKQDTKQMNTKMDLSTNCYGTNNHYGNSPAEYNIWGEESGIWD